MHMLWDYCIPSMPMSGVLDHRMDHWYSSYLRGRNAKEVYTGPGWQYTDMPAAQQLPDTGEILLTDPAEELKYIGV